MFGKIPLTISSVSTSVDGDAHEALWCAEHAAFHSTPVLTACGPLLGCAPAGLNWTPALVYIHPPQFGGPQAGLPYTPQHLPLCSAGIVHPWDKFLAVVLLGQRLCTLELLETGKIPFNVHSN